MAAPAMSTAKEGSSADYALRYAELGWRVLPVVGKRPRIKNWTKAASTELTAIRKWFPKDWNIGIAPGRASGIVVVDVDPRNGGDLTLKRWERELGVLPETVKAKTGGGGVHLVFRWFPNARNDSSDGVDFLADGKMFVVAPSVHPGTGAVYEWASDPFDQSPAELPEPWQRHFSGRKTSAQAESAAVVAGSRNDHLASLAGRLKAEGAGPTLIRNKLLEYNATECDPPLPDDEVLAIAASIGSYTKSGKSLKTQWQEAVCKADLPQTTKLVLFMLSMFADADGKSCWPTQEQIAEWANCSRRTVGKRLLEAAEDGWISRYTNPRAAGRGFNYGYVLTRKEANEVPN